MRFLQHVYGRVARGYRGYAPGYQLAALSEALAERTDMVEKLNRFSFFNLRGGKGTEARYSFYRPAEGFLAFGCSRLARDRSGAVGSFAHHFVCDEDEFIRGGVSPAEMLKYLVEDSKFLDSESRLPQNRSLPEADFEPPATHTTATGWRPLGGHLVNLYLDKSERTTPLVIAPEGDTWTILDEVFGLLPRLEATRLSFSTLFIEASDFTESFRLVFIPDGRYVPAEAYNYMIFEPAAEPVTTPPPRPVPLIALCIKAQGDAEHLTSYESFLEFVHVLRHERGRLEEAAALMPGLLAYGKTFRDCVESLQIPWIYSLILRDRKTLVDYRRAGEPLKYEDAAPELWEHHEAYLPQLLPALADLGQQRFADSVLGELARRVSSGEVDTRCLGLLSPEQQGSFYGHVRRELRVGELCSLAEKLRGHSFYDGQLHEYVAQLVVADIGEGLDRRWPGPLQWLREEQRVLPARSLGQAALALGAWACSEGGPNFRLADFRADGQQYEELLKAVWRLAKGRAISASVFSSCAFSHDHRGRFFSFMVRQLGTPVLAMQKAILDIMAERYGSQAVAEREFVEALKRSENTLELAKLYKRLLAERGDLDPYTRRILDAVINDSRWRFF
jgi:hypothetical protein